MPPNKVDTSLKFATSDSSHLVLRWELFRPRYGNTVELVTGERPPHDRRLARSAASLCPGAVLCVSGLVGAPAALPSA